jgi:hypothetical protein
MGSCVPFDSGNPPDDQNPPDDHSTVGTVWIDPASQTISTGASVATEIHANTGDSLLAAFGFTVTYPVTMFSFSKIEEITTGLNLTTNATAAGQVIIAGFNTPGITGSNDLAMVRITLNASTQKGTGNIGFSIKDLTDDSIQTIGVPTAIGGSITVQ